MRIAILSDIHEGVNRKNTGANMVAIIKNWLVANEPDVFITSGDMTAGAEKSLNLLQTLQRDFPKMKILFVHGNHDIYADDSNQAYNTLLQFPGNLGNGPVELNNGWVVIGEGGWYDYSFGLKEFSLKDYEKGTYGDSTWPDKTYANWGMSDVERTNHYISKLEKWLAQYEHKNIIMVTHVVPFKEFVQVKNNPEWDFFNSMMGSIRFGELALKYCVKKYIFGHIHTRYETTHEGIDILCNPLGYFPHEWTNKSPEDEINKRFKMFTA